MKLIINETNISRVYGCIKAVQGNLANDIRLLEIELKNPLAWTNEAKKIALQPYNDASEAFYDCNRLLMMLYIKNKKDWHKSTFGYAEDKKARIEAIDKTARLFKAVGVDLSDKPDLSFPDLERAHLFEVEYQMKRISCRSTIEEEIANNQYTMVKLSLLESKIIVGLILEAPELNLIQFKN